MGMADDLLACRVLAETELRVFFSGIEVEWRSCEACLYERVRPSRAHMLEFRLTSHAYLHLHH